MRSAPFAEIYGASVPKETISRITDKALGGPGVGVRASLSIHTQ